MWRSEPALSRRSRSSPTSSSTSSRSTACRSTTSARPSPSYDPANSFSVFGPTGIAGGLFSGELTVDIQSILTANAVLGEATGVRISFDNTPQAFHAGGGQALIRKRDADFVSLTINGGNPVPRAGHGAAGDGRPRAARGRRHS
ncbi:MAG: hypothetical protein R3E53_14325 [Myxococcota bacterium]